MKNCNQSVKINDSPSRPNIHGHSDRILIIDGSGSGKTIVSLNLHNQKIQKYLLIIHKQLVMFMKI